VEAAIDYPRAEIYPVDKVCNEIVTEVINRCGDVSWIEVFSQERIIHGVTVVRVCNLKGEDFELTFNRKQDRQIQGKDSYASIYEIYIPGHQFRMYSDNSGPTYYLYVGNDWKNDRGIFESEFKTMPKITIEPRTYLLFEGSREAPKGMEECFIPETVYAPYLIHDNGDGMQYDPLPGERSWYTTEEVMEIFDSWLRENVLKRLLDETF
jgi:hypothetical protein